MTYYDSAEGIKVNYKRAKMEVEKHGVSMIEFIEEFGEHDEYDAQEVLLWLGY